MTSKLNLFYARRSATRIMVFLNALHVATISYSETTKKWYVNFYSISTDVYELGGDKAEVVQKIKEVCEEWLSGTRIA